MSEPVDPIQKAVDDYLLMEAKARAWDALVRLVCDVPRGAPIHKSGLMEKMSSLLNQQRKTDSNL